MDAVENSPIGHLADNVPHHQDPSKERPGIFNFLVQQGRNENAKQFLNQILLRVALQLKSPDDVPYQPVTVCMLMRTLFGEFTRQGLSWKMQDFKGWEGAFQDVIDAAWAEHMKKDSEFGKKHKKEFTQEDKDLVDAFINTLSDEGRKDWLNHIAHYNLGCSYGLRGRDEHANLDISDFVFGVYPANFPGGLGGSEYIRLKDEILTKTNHLTMCKLIFVLRGAKRRAWRAERALFALLFYE